MIAATELNKKYEENKLVKKISRKIQKLAKKGFHSYTYRIKAGNGIIVSNEIPFADAYFIKKYFENLDYEVKFILFCQTNIIGVQINW